MTHEETMHPDPDPAAEARRALEAALYECKRVVVGQDAMLERLLVALLTGGHVLLEGVPGLAKTLTVRTLATVLGGSFSRIQFTPDLVPADLVGTRIWQPGDGTFRTELGPVFANLLLADEINRAPAKVQSALLEVMQEHQVTVGGETYRVPEPYLVLATQNPIESEGTYDLPEAQVDRFLFKLVVDYPALEDEIAVVDRVSADPPRASRAVEIDDLLDHQRVARSVFADRSTMTYAVSLVDATRHPGRYGLAELEPLIQFGASPRASLGLVQAARALALLRGRTHVAHHDVRDLAADVLRHRLVLSYDALADGVRPDELVDRLLERVEPTAPLRLAEAA
jgi:MoxR-like ATPase